MRTAIFVLITLLSLALSSAPAQRVDSSLHGQLTDRSGGIVSEAAVTIRNTATGAAREVTTNRQGYFAAPALAAGSYVLEAQKAGFKKARREDIVQMLQGERRRLAENTSTFVQKDIKTHIYFLEKSTLVIDDELSRTIRSSRLWI